MGFWFPFELAHEDQFFQKPIVSGLPPGVLFIAKTLVSPAATVKDPHWIAPLPSSARKAPVVTPPSDVIHPGASSQSWYWLPGVSSVVKFRTPPFALFAVSDSTVEPLL